MRMLFTLSRELGKSLMVEEVAEILEKHFPFIRPSHVTIEFGKPFYIKELPAEDRKRAGAYSEARIREMLVKEQEERRSLRKA